MDPYTTQLVREGYKVSIFVDRTRNCVSIKINGQSQGVLFEYLPRDGDLYLAIDFRTRNETLRMPEAIVTSGWCCCPHHVEIDALEFKIT